MNQNGKKERKSGNNRGWMLGGIKRTVATWDAHPENRVQLPSPLKNTATYDRTLDPCRGSPEAI